MNYVSLPKLTVWSGDICVVQCDDVPQGTVVGAVLFTKQKLKMILNKKIIYLSEKIYTYRIKHARNQLVQANIQIKIDNAVDYNYHMR